MYRKAENFRGRKLSQIARFCRPKDATPPNLWSEEPQNHEIHKKFSPSKVSRYTVLLQALAHLLNTLSGLILAECHIIPLLSHVGVLLESTVQGWLSGGEAGPRRAGGLYVGHQRGDEGLCVTGVL